MRAFIYGTLKRGHRAHDRLAGQRFLREAATAPHYRLVDAGGFPGLVSGTHSVQGELWELTQDRLRELDDYEGVAEGIYARARIEMSDGSAASAYLYLRPASGLRDCGARWTLEEERADPPQE